MQDMRSLKVFRLYRRHIQNSVTLADMNTRINLPKLCRSSYVGFGSGSIVSKFKSTSDTSGINPSNSTSDSIIK